MVKILLVLGRPETGPAVESALENEDAALLRAESGADALRRFLEGEFAVVLVDVELSDMSGLELAARIRDHDRFAPIIFLGAGADFPVEEAYALGAVDHLSAPLAPTVLRSKVAMFVELFERAQERRAVAVESTSFGTPGREDLWRTALAGIGDAVGRFTGLTSERRLADIARARLAAIVESSNDAIVGKDLSGTILSWNSGAERIFGHAADEAIGRSITLIVPEDRLEEESTILGRLRRGERIEHFETKRLRKDGRLIDVSLTISPIRDAEGNVIGASKIARDVTDAKRAERALASALQAGEVGTYYWDIKADRITGDRNFVAIFGALAHEEAWAPISDLMAEVHPGDRERVAAEIARTLADDTPFRSEYRVRGPRGERWLLSRGAVERAPDGEAVGWAGVVIDITERKTAEEALAASRARLDFAVRASGLGFWYCDLPFGELDWDDRVKAHFHLPPDARVTIETFYERLHPDDREPTRAAIEASIAGRTGCDLHYRTVDPVTGAEKWLRAIGRASADESGEPRRFDGVTLDVTEQRRTEAAIRESNDRFAIVARATNDAVWDWDMRTNTVWWNEGVSSIFGYRRDEVGAGAEWWRDRIHPDDRDRVVSGIHGVIGGGGGRWTDEYRFLKADGSYAAVYDRGYAIQEDGKTIRLVGAMRDVTEQQRARERIRESEQRFRTLFESMDDGYCVVEPIFDADGRPVDYRYLMANPAMERQTGLTDIVGKTAREVMPNHEEHWIEGYAHAAETGELFRRTDYVADLHRWFDVSAFRIGPPGDRRVGVLFNDVSDRKRSEALLREKDERLKLLVEQVKDYAVIVTDPAGRVLEWSDGAEIITGHAAEDIFGWPIEVIFTAEDRAAGAPAKEMERAARDGRVEHLRWHERKDGNQFFAEGVMVPLWGDDGALRGFGKVFRDVTDRRRAEESVRFLADASATLAELVDYSSTLNRIAKLAVDGFADWCVVDLVDEDGRRERIAVTAAQSTNLAAARSADREFQSADGAAGLAPHALRTGEPEVVTDLTTVDPSTAPQGPERILRLRELGVRSYLCVPFVSRGRVIGGMTFLSSSTRRRFGPEQLRVAQDLAERVTVAIENAQLYRALQEQDRRKDEFLATLAHELRNPLAPIRNGLQILRMGAANTDAAGKTLSMMDRQLGHVTHLVEDLMDVARVSSGKVKLRMERAPLAEIVDAAVETSRRMIDAAGHQFTLRMPAEPLTVEGDRTRLVQVLSNLLNNAAKYTPPGGRVELTAERDGANAAIRIADNGVGISTEMLPKVFEMFAQVGASLERSQGGLGIGLTLVKRLVEMHGGSVTAESPGANQGSVFTVRIPLAEEAETTSETEPVATAEATARPLDVLVVDDNRDSAVTLAMLLELRGHRVKVAHEGPEALRMLANYRPRLILLDLGLPGMSGYEVAHRIRESPDLRDVTLAALTGWGQEEDRRRTRDAGFDHHVVKPAEPEELDRIVQGVRAGGGR